MKKNSDMTKQERWRANQKKQGKSARQFYLTDTETKRLIKYLEEVLRKKKTKTTKQKKEA